MNGSQNIIVVHKIKFLLHLKFKPSIILQLDCDVHS